MKITRKINEEEEYFNRIRDIDWIDLLKAIGLTPIRKTRKGEFLMRCIFHRERTPSLTFSDSKGLFKCFGCGAAGDKFLFASTLLKSKRRAFRFFRRKFGVEKPF